MLKTHAGVFEGIGGFSLAAQRCGLTTKWVCEINTYRKQILRQHFPNAYQYRNIVNVSNPERVDILTGGFPCQDISVAGKSIGIIGPQSRLWAEYLRVIYESRPGYVIIENSAQLSNKGLEFILYDLAKIGYDAQWECLRAFEFGYPHIRERLFIVAYPAENGRRQKGQIQIFQSIAEVFGKPPGQLGLSVPVKRITPKANYNSVSGNYGLSKGLDKCAIAAIGDAVIPRIAEYIIKCIQRFDEQNTLTNAQQ